VHPGHTERGVQIWYVANYADVNIAEGINAEREIKRNGPGWGGLSGIRSAWGGILLTVLKAAHRKGNQRKTPLHRKIVRMIKMW